MNFLLKNLGWILLLLFFLFMLFIISMSGDKKKMKDDSGIIQTNLDILEEKLDEEEVSEKSDDHDDSDDDSRDEDTHMTKDVSEANISEEASSESLFSKLFSRKESTKSDDDNGESTSETSVEEEFSIEKDESKMDNALAFVKNTGTVDSHQISAEAQKYLREELLYTGLDIEPAVGKTYNIGVHSLKLNNKYFNETLGYLTKGDTFTQRTDANSYGCFEVEVTNSDRDSNVGKVGYVCKKWLLESHEDMSNESTTMDDSITRVHDVTHIGEVHTAVSETEVNSEVTLQVGDTVDQMSEMDMTGCFTGLIRSSAESSNVGKVVEVCINDISN